jgi:transposase
MTGEVSTEAISQDEKVQVVELMLAGHHWQEATEQVGITISESTAYRWVRCWRQDGRAGLSDGRHGHARKMSAEVRAWLKEYCDHARHTPRTRQGLIKAELETLWQAVHRAWDNHQREWAKGCRYVHKVPHTRYKERKLLRQLADLETQERQMFELDNSFTPISDAST